MKGPWDFFFSATSKPLLVLLVSREKRIFQNLSHEHEFRGVELMHDGQDRLKTKLVIVSTW